LKGNEDLGAGLKAIFKLESGFGLNDGRLKQGGRLFGRQAWVALASGLGSVTLGRQFAASDAVATIADIAVTGSSLSAYKSQFYWKIDWLDNSLLYSSPKMGGCQAFLGKAFGKKTDTAGGSTVTTGLLYSEGPLAAGISLESWTTSAFSSSVTDYNFWNLAASCDLGVVALVAGFSADDVNQDISSTSAVKSKTYALGAKLPAGSAGKVVFLLQVIKPENGPALNITSLGYIHTLSKRTALYSQITVANNPVENVYGRKNEVTIGVRYQFDIRLCGN
jgi:predicted porin